MKARWFLAVVSVLGMLPSPAFAALDAGGTESPFALGMGARALGLGKAYTAVADDATALYWNPAGLAHVRQMELAACHVFLNEGTTYDVLGYVHPVYGFGTLGLAGMNIQTGGIERRDDHDYLLGTFGYRQSQGLLSLGRELFPGLGAGFSLKAEQMVLDTYQGTGVGLDLGFLYNPAGVLSFGLVLQNILPPEFRFVEPVSLPMDVRLGGAFRCSLDGEGNHRLLASAEVEKGASNLLLLHGGLEYALYRTLALRAGWDRDRISGGAGVVFMGIGLDYALTYQETSGYLHIASLNWRFGLPVDEAEQIRRRKATEETFAGLVQQEFARLRAEGVTLLNSDRALSAAEAFKRALGWKPDAETSAQLARARELIGKQTARQYGEQGRSEADEGRWLEALVTLRESLQLDPAEEPVRLRIRELKAKLTRRAQTARLTGAQKRLRTRFLAALNRYLEGEYAKACEGWRAVLEENAAYPDAREYTAQAQQVVLRREMLVSVKDSEAEARVRAKLKQADEHYTKRRFRQAREFWLEALKTDPTNETAKLGVERADLILKALKARGLE